MEAFGTFVFLWLVMWLFVALAYMFVFALIDLWDYLDDGGRFLFVVTSVSLIITTTVISLGL